MANTESTKAFYSQIQKQSCTLHPAGDHTHLPLSYPASITEITLCGTDVTKSTLLMLKG